MSSSGGGEKEYAPTQKRLDEAFDRGNFPKSADLSGAISIALVTVFVFFGVDLIALSMGHLVLIFDHSASQGGISVYTFVYDVMIAAFVAVLLPFAFLSVLSLIISRFRFPVSKLLPKVDRLSLIKGMKNKFGIRALKNAFGVIVKLMIVTMFALYFSVDVFALLCIQCVGPISESLSNIYVVVIMLVFLFLVIGVLDYCVRVIFWRKELRMDRTELVKEQKDQEGDSMLKSQRRKLAINLLAEGGSVTAVSKSDVLIINPAHYAVAISWQRELNKPPMVIAKGVDHMALIMRDFAQRNNIPLYRDPVSARSIYSSVRVGRSIERGHYRAVASAIRFAAMVKRQKK